VTARENKSKAVITDVVGARHFGLVVGVGHEQGNEPLVGRVATHLVNREASSHRGQPPSWFLGDAIDRPVSEGTRVRLLRALFGGVDVARDPHRGGEHEGPLVAVRLRDRNLGVSSCRTQVGMMGRTSTPPRAAGTSLAMAIASSRSAASMR